MYTIFLFQSFKNYFPTQYFETYVMNFISPNLEKE